MPTKIFISYNHQDKAEATRLKDALRQAGHEVVIDSEAMAPGGDIVAFIEKSVRETDFTLSLVSPHSLLSAWVAMESVLSFFTEKALGKERFVPVFLDDCFFKKDFTDEAMDAVDEQILEIKTLLKNRLEKNRGVEDLQNELTRLRELNHRLPEIVRRLRESLSVDLRSDRFDQGMGLLLRRFDTVEVTQSHPDTPLPIVNTARLPYDPSTVFIGRKAELDLLDKAWQDPNIRLVEFVAQGGAGKTALVGQWLGRMAADDYRGAKRVYAWSFYSQGAGEQRQSSADSFFLDMLRWFGEDVEALPKSYSDRARLLAEHIRRQPTLLLLDGVEPLQYLPGPEDGKLKDPGLSILLRELAMQNPGLCVLSTRFYIGDLTRHVGQGLLRHSLEHLSDAEGAELLARLGVSGKQAEREAVAHEYDGHALALQLLGNYLRKVHRGDLRRRDHIRALTREEKQGGHAKRVLEAYVRWFSDGEHGPELALLSLLGLFDRPAPVAALDALAGDAGLDDLVAPLRGADSERQTLAFRHLEELKLLFGEGSGRFGRRLRHLPGLADWEELDAHPLVREFFGEKMERERADLFRRAHGILYEYYRDLPDKELPDTIEEMEPLFAAVMHGCRAGRQEETRKEVYWKRIRREAQAYSVKQLGAFGSDLTALAWFFEQLWDKPSGKLTEHVQSFVLSWAGFGLRALGRLGEAAQPMRAGMDLSIRDEDWKGAAADASNLSELYLSIGDIAQAVRYGGESVDYADRSGDGFQKEGRRTTHADALHAAGDLNGAARLFAAAEAMQQESQPEYKFLYSLRGFRYCDLLLGLGRVKEVLERAVFAIEIAHEYNDLLSIALDHLSLGKAHTLLYQASKDESHRAAAEQHLNEAVAGLEKAGQQDDMPRGFLARAHYRRLLGDWAGAAQDLAAVLDIAEPSGMRLHLCDYHLESARLALARGQGKEARSHWQMAGSLVSATGYHRRDGELRELEEALG